MKKIRSITAVMLCFLVLFCSGCGTVVRENADKTDGENKAESAEKSLYEHGLEVIESMRELAPHIDIFSDNAEIQSIVLVAARGDYSEPKAVYKITVDNIGTIMNEIFDTIGNLPDSVMESISSRMISGMTSQLVASGGSTVLAAASLCTASKLFVSAELNEDMQYIYVFENAPPVAVSFIGGEDNAVYATGMFLFSAEFLNEMSGEFEEDIFYKFWDMMGMKVEKIK